MLHGEEFYAANVAISHRSRGDHVSRGVYRRPIGVSRPGVLWPDPAVAPTTAATGLKRARWLPITRGMTLATTLERIAEIQTLVDPQAAARAAAARQTAYAGSATPVVNEAGSATFAKALRGAEAAGAPQGTNDMVAAARTQNGVTEQPPGSNDSPQIKTYRDAVAGAPGPGPWCAYFVSWAAKQSGTPLGDQGQGFASVDAMWAWAQRAGKATPNGPGVKPQVGDVIILNQHTGIVTGVKADGTVQTIEGNTSDKVAERTHPAGEAIGYIHVK